MKGSLERLKEEALVLIDKAPDEQELLSVKARYLGKKGEITAIMKEMGSLSPSERPAFGQLVNVVKDTLEAAFTGRFLSIKKMATEDSLKKEKVDITLPGRRVQIGKRHPLSIVMDEVVGIFTRIGFSVADGPEIETDYYNFEALNIPRDHPARDMQDTFYISEDIVLRTHTSPVQIRTMERQAPPIRIIAPGSVYRCDSDVTHSPMFHQVEGLIVDKGISFGDLKGILKTFVGEMFGEDVSLRFRPSFFPFTEPSAEVDIQCVLCRGDGCRVCSGTGWLEIMGCGMVDPAVFSFVKYDPEIYTGFAFGMGIERIAMLKYKINDIRLFFENDIRFLNQF
ncbi:MAG: phenylalanine--tRNA ligase subunit alpha [Deltaproteobacteria bacterium GWA2_47_9]|nr:MAG: phenylalanine--tRNA ligase subunit alpha [Deltaproteobacteria bacterium GWA2_47_9]